MSGQVRQVVVVVVFFIAASARANGKEFRALKEERRETSRLASVTIDHIDENKL
jgi:hypothetical protein